MEKKCVARSSCLRESDIPGASLGDRNPNSLKIPELKRWLICRTKWLFLLARNLDFVFYFYGTASD